LSPYCLAVFDKPRTALRNELLVCHVSVLVQ